MRKTVTALQIVKCPKCGRVGQLQRYKRIHQSYYRVTHYKGDKVTLIDNHWKQSGFIGTYSHTCYIGKEYNEDK
jgi:hypothetical protein